MKERKKMDIRWYEVSYRERRFSNITKILGSVLAILVFGYIVFSALSTDSIMAILFFIILVIALGVIYVNYVNSPIAVGVSGDGIYIKSKSRTEAVLWDVVGELSSTKMFGSVLLYATMKNKKKRLIVGVNKRMIERNILDDIYTQFEAYKSSKKPE